MAFPAKTGEPSISGPTDLTWHQRPGGIFSGSWVNGPRWSCGAHRAISAPWHRNRLLLETVATLVRSFLAPKGPKRLAGGASPRKLTRKTPEPRRGESVAGTRVRLRPCRGSSLKGSPTGGLRPRLNAFGPSGLPWAWFRTNVATVSIALPRRLFPLPAARGVGILPPVAHTHVHRVTGKGHDHGRQEAWQEAGRLGRFPKKE